MDGEIDEIAFVDLAFELTGEFYLDSFIAGMVAGGVDGEPNAEEAGYVWWEIDFVHDRLRAFADDLAAGLYDGKVSSALRRADLYGAHIEYVWWQGLGFAAGDQIYEWSIGSTREHCADCLAYHGQRHRMSEWRAVGALPQSYGLECHGFECKCELNPARGQPVGNLLPPGAN